MAFLGPEAPNHARSATIDRAMTGSAPSVIFLVIAVEDGAPIGGATVGLGLARDSTVTHGTLRVETTDSAGRVTFPVDPGANLAGLFVCAPGRRPFLGAGRAKSRSGGAVAALPGTVALAPGLTFAGILRDTRGQPVAGARVGLIAEGPNWASDGPGASFGREHWPPVESDAHGRFAWCWFDPQWFDRDDARCSLTVEHDGYVRATIPLGKDLMTPGVRDVTAVLDEGCSLRVEVTDAAGRVRDDAEVEVCLAMRGGAMSDSYGKAATRATGGGLVARGLRPARHRVEARAPGCAPRAVFVDVARLPRLPVRIRLRRA